MLNLIINSFWLVLPAYFANSSPVLLRGKIPIDRKRKFVDNYRLLGDGKTIEGFVGGFLIGVLAGLLQIYLQSFIPSSYLQFNHTVITIVLLSFGASFGDLIGSFVKRRFNLKRGEPAPLLDQLDFLIFSLILVSLVISISLSAVIILVVITPLIHLFSNFFAYLFKLKKEPW
jgi:CDP-2,3-bis-(O-geranylgeranyl)-sn-glycerol synthase